MALGRTKHCYVAMRKAWRRTCTLCVGCSDERAQATLKGWGLEFERSLQQVPARVMKPEEIIMRNPRREKACVSSSTCTSVCLVSQRLVLS